MTRDRKVVDIAEFAARNRQEAPAVATAEVARFPRSDRLTPVGVSGLFALAASGVFCAYVLVRAAQVGVLDGFVLAVLASGIAAGAVGLTMFLVASRIRSVAMRWSRNYDTPTAALVTIQELRQRRLSHSPLAIRACQYCGAEYEAVTPDAACTSCGRATRTA